MNTDVFFRKVRSYHPLSVQSEKAWKELLSLKKYRKGDAFVAIGEKPKKVAFVINGLLSQNFITGEGDVIIKYFFPEQRFAASLSAMLSGRPSLFYIEAIEDTSVFEYDFFEFKTLVEQYPDIAQFYIKYNEQHWIIDKEPLEVAFRTETSAKRYDDFLKKYPELLNRLKKHHIASYLGITPTQLSRIFFSNR